MAFKMGEWSAFTKPEDNKKEKKFFKRDDQEIRRRKTPKHPQGIDINTETVGKEKKSGKSKTFIKTIDKNTGKVTYTKNINKVGKHPTEGNVKEISEKKYLRKKKRYKKKKGFEDRTSKQSKIKTDKNKTS